MEDCQGSEELLEVTWQGPKPKKCQVCNRPLEGFVDGKTVGGWWACMCEVCHVLYGVGFGMGRGQQYDSRGVKIR